MWRAGANIEIADLVMPTRDAPPEIPVLMFVMVEQATGAFTLRCVSNDTVIDDLRNQGALDTFLADTDELYAKFRKRFEGTKTCERPN
jgi:hypothetical protein